MKLTTTAREKLRKEAVKRKIADALNRSLVTVNRWTHTDNYMYAEEKNLKVLMKVTGLKEDEIFDKTEK
ncbi:hypothetical protein ACIRNY_10880 [Capnocytophaga canimorsus]|uniref:hypothetical protein n=1 Tax=Capnocytophaga canimorsus TaxID=28188 RepID=UPI0037CF3BFF